MSTWEIKNGLVLIHYQNIKCLAVHSTKTVLALTHINRRMWHANPVYRWN